MFEDQLHSLAEQHLLRELKTVDSATNPVISLGNRPTLLFASNNYLGLANHPAVKQAAQAAIQQFGVGAGASRLISGTLPPHEDLEQALADFKGTQASLTFSSGYMANLGVIAALTTSEGLILGDRRCHASLIDGCRLSKATIRLFHHNDMDHLQKLLARRSGKRLTLIVTEGVFSMDGDLAPLPELVTLAREYEATLLLDDAHGTGVMGPTGRGTFQHFGVNPQDFIHMGTLSKALGTSGGFIAGETNLKAYLINKAKTFIYSTAPPPAIAAGASTALTVIQQEPKRLFRLWENRDYVFKNLRDMGFQMTSSQSPILPIILNDPGLAVEMSQQLLQRGIYIPAIRPPTIPKGTSRLRVTVTADHTREHLETLLTSLQEVATAIKVL